VKTASLDLFIFADALGWELVERRNFLADILPYRHACRTLLGYSCTFDPTILTGLLPVEHGHFSFFVYDPQRSPFGWAKKWAWLPQKFGAHHRVRNRVSRWVAQSAGYTGYFQLYSVPFNRLPYLDYTEKKDIYESDGIIAGHEVIFRLWERSGLPWLKSDWRRGDLANVAQIKEEVTKGRVRLAYLFTAGLDAVMHAHGTRGAAVDAAFDQFERWVREIHDLAGHGYEKVRIHVFSDHGMADTRSASRMMLDFEALGLEYGRDYAAVWDSTMVRFWFPGGEKRAVVAAWLEGRKEGRILTEEELLSSGALFPDRRYGELFYLLNEGVIFVPSYMNQGLVRGMHGYAPSAPSSAACWLSNHREGPDPQGINEIHQAMAWAAGTKAAGLKKNFPDESS
jgi:hypothetical protein